MVIGILKDIKKGENRVIATPGEVATLIGDGNTVKVQKGAGEKAGFEDQAYAEAGAVLVDTAEEIYGTCEFVTKVKEFEPSEFDLLREGQIVFTCIHPTTPPPRIRTFIPGAPPRPLTNLPFPPLMVSMDSRPNRAPCLPAASQFGEP